MFEHHERRFMILYRGKTVVITGGSTGIGAAFARFFAREGARLVLVARSKPKLDALAAELRSATGVEVHTVSEDLSVLGAASRVREAVRALGWSTDLLVNNAGFATYGPFETQSLLQVREEISLNVGGLVELTHVFLPDLIERRGGVIHVASTAAFQSVPFMAVYAATKAFVLSFSEALWAENRARGVKVLALCPGATDTPFFERVGSEDAALGQRATPESVVGTAMKAFSSNRSHVIAGLGNYWAAQTNRLVSRQISARLTFALMKPRSLAKLPEPSAR
jgi:short-subunit dehydrogenase